MRFPGGVLAAGALVQFFILGLPSGAAQEPGADVIVTAVPVYLLLAALGGGERFPQGAELLLVHAGKAAPLVSGFAASADASVSFDGKRVLFAGKKSEQDHWQIWEMTLADGSVRRVVADDGDDIRPLHLPGLLPEGRLVFAHRTGQGFQLISARLSEPPAAMAKIDTVPAQLQLTYLAASAVPADVLADGRILFEAGFPLGAGVTPELYLVYQDGSGVEAYRCDHGRARWGGRQLSSGDVVFTHGTSLARFSSPLAHEAPVAAPRGEYAGAIAEMASGAWLLSVRAGRAAKKGELPENRPSGAKARVDSTPLTARLKSCPFKAVSFSGARPSGTIARIDSMPLAGTTKVVPLQGGEFFRCLRLRDALCAQDFEAGRSGDADGAGCERQGSC